MIKYLMCGTDHRWLGSKRQMSVSTKKKEKEKNGCAPITK